MATQTGTKKTAIAWGRTLALVYGTFCYLTFLLLPVPKKQVIPAERRSEDERETLS